jgi:group I intron endonuclease
MKNYKELIGYIYKIISPNGKIYIGQTINVNQRKRKYKSNGFKGQVKLWQSCEKNNWSPIDTFEIIEECLCGVDKIVLNEREKYWINFYNSFKDGLNCNEGGSGNLGKKHSKETKQKISLKTLDQWSKMSEETKKLRGEKIGTHGKTRKHSKESIDRIKQTKKDNPFKPTEEFKQKISQSLIGKQGRNTGNTHSAESKEKISLAKKGVSNEKIAKKVFCITNGKIYKSTQEAASKLNLTQGKVSLTCNGKILMTKGYKFKFL